MNCSNASVCVCEGYDVYISESEDVLHVVKPLYLCVFNNVLPLCS